MAYARRWCSYLREEVLGIESREYMWYDKNGPWETPRITKIIQHKSAQYLSQAFGSLDIRHQTFSQANEHINPHFSHEAKDEVDEIEEPEVEEKNIQHLEARRGKIQKDLKYTVPINIINHLSIRSLRAFRLLSKAWHQFLRFRNPSKNERLRSKSRKQLAVRLYPNKDAERRSQSRGHSQQLVQRRLFDSSSPNTVEDKQDHSQSSSRINWPVLERASQLSLLARERVSPLARERFTQVAILIQHRSSSRENILYSTTSTYRDHNLA